MPKCSEKGCRKSTRHSLNLELRGATLKEWHLCPEARDRIELVITEALNNSPGRKRKTSKKREQTGAPAATVAE